MKIARLFPLVTQMKKSDLYFDYDLILELSDMGCLNIEELMTAENFSGENLIAIGDGAGEIMAAKALGGLAIAVCSDEEHNGSGLVDEHKRATLVDAGADAIIADYREPKALLNKILGE